MEEFFCRITTPTVPTDSNRLFLIIFRLEIHAIRYSQCARYACVQVYVLVCVCVCVYTLEAHVLLMQYSALTL